jgi:co-chaperonin GroES (HSP10)
MAKTKVSVRPITNHVIVQIDDRFNDSIDMGNGKKLYIETSFAPAEHVRIYGNVVSTPLRGNSKYSVENRYIVPEVLSGDKIYFHYNTLLSQTNRLDDNLWFVPYHSIFCVVRNNKIKMIGGWTLVKPIIERRGKINGIIAPEAYQEKKATNFGILKHIGTPQTNQAVLPVKTGDYVYFSELDCFENNIEGNTYYCMQQEDLLYYTKKEHPMNCKETSTTKKTA